MMPIHQLFDILLHLFQHKDEEGKNHEMMRTKEIVQNLPFLPLVKLISHRDHHHHHHRAVAEAAAVAVFLSSRFSTIKSRLPARMIMTCSFTVGSNVEEFIIGRSSSVSIR